MKYLFVIWLGEKPVEKIFTSLRIILWANALNKILEEFNNVFLMMLDINMNHSFIDLIDKLNLLNNVQKDFLEAASHDQRQILENLLKTSEIISHDCHNQLMINIEHIDQDYLLKTSKDTSSKYNAYLIAINPFFFFSFFRLVLISDQHCLFNKLYTFGKVLDKNVKSNLNRRFFFLDIVFVSQYFL